MIKAIIFDCFGVLTNSSWKEYWLSLPTPAIQEQARRLNQAYDRAEITKEQFSENLQALTGHLKSEIEKVLYDPAPIKNKQLLSYIKTLKADYKIAILSNIANNWIKDYLLTKDEQRLFDDMLFSFQFGITKPDPRIYYLAAERLGVTTKECVFVDDIERYCRAATDCGMKAIFYQSFEQMKKELQKIIGS